MLLGNEFLGMLQQAYQLHDTELGEYASGLGTCGQILDALKRRPLGIFALLPVVCDRITTARGADELASLLKVLTTLTSPLYLHHALREFHEHREWQKQPVLPWLLRTSTSLPWRIAQEFVNVTKGITSDSFITYTQLPEQGVFQYYLPAEKFFTQAIASYCKYLFETALPLAVQHKQFATLENTFTLHHALAKQRIIDGNISLQKYKENHKDIAILLIEPISAKQPLFIDSLPSYSLPLPIPVKVGVLAEGLRQKQDIYPLLEHWQLTGADIDIDADTNTQSFFYRVVQHEQWQAAAYLLEQLPGISYPYTVLHVAARYNEAVALVARFLQKHPGFNCFNPGSTGIFALTIAAEHNNWAMVALLADNTHLNGINNRVKAKALEACQQAMRLLLEKTKGHDFDPIQTHAFNKLLATKPTLGQGDELHLAATKPTAAVFCRLSAGVASAQLWQANREGKTPFDIALAYLRHSIAQVLLAAFDPSQLIARLEKNADQTMRSGDLQQKFAISYSETDTDTHLLSKHDAQAWMYAFTLQGNIAAAYYVLQSLSVESRERCVYPVLHAAAKQEAAALSPDPEDLPFVTHFLQHFPATDLAEKIPLKTAVTAANAIQQFALGIAAQHGNWAMVALLAHAVQTPYHREHALLAAVPHLSYANSDAAPQQLMNTCGYALLLLLQTAGCNPFTPTQQEAFNHLLAITNLRVGLETLPNGQNAFHLAASHGDGACLEQLLAKCRNRECLGHVASDGSTPLSIAMQADHTELAKVIELATGVVMNQSDFTLIDYMDAEYWPAVAAIAQQLKMNDTFNKKRINAWDRREITAYQQVCVIVALHLVLKVQRTSQQNEALTALRQLVAEPLHQQVTRELQHALVIKDDVKVQAFLNFYLQYNLAVPASVRESCMAWINTLPAEQQANYRGLTRFPLVRAVFAFFHSNALNSTEKTVPCVETRSQHRL